MGRFRAEHTADWKRLNMLVSYPSALAVSDSTCGWKYPRIRTHHLISDTTDIRWVGTHG